MSIVFSIAFFADFTSGRPGFRPSEGILLIIFLYTGIWLVYNDIINRSQGTTEYVQRGIS